MIFQTDIQHIDTELSQLQALLDAKRQQRSLFEELDAETNAAIEKVALLKIKIEAVSCDAIASLKTAVLQLFTDGGNNRGNQPAGPKRGPDDDELELLCLNGLTGECLTTTDDQELPVDDPTGDEWILSSSAPLTGQTCTIDPELYWQTNAPDGSYWEFASPLSCLLWDDAPLTGQHCTITPSTSVDNENKSTKEGKDMPYVELVQHPDNEALAYQRKHDGQIVCTYLGFRTKVIASSWLRAVEVLTSAVELRQAKRLEGFKWELKAKGLSMTQIDRLARENLTRTYRQEITEAVKPPTYKEPERKLPVNPDEVKPGDIVTPLLTPGDSYEIIQVMPNGILDCRSLRTGVNMGMRPGAVSLLSKGEKPQPVEPIEFNDVVEVVADGNDTVGLVGTFGRVKTVKNDRIGVEVDEQLVYFNKAELKLKVKAQAPTHQRKSSSPTDASLSAQEATYLQTNGNYLGLAKQTRQRWEQAGINPSDLIADMRANRPTEPAWDAAKYNPVLAAISSEYDF